MQSASQDKISVVKELLSHPYIDTRITDKVIVFGFSSADCYITTGVFFFNRIVTLLLISVLKEDTMSISNLL
jgi:hypothetical protein